MEENVLSSTHAFAYAIDNTFIKKLFKNTTNFLFEILPFFGISILSEIIFYEGEKFDALATRIMNLH